MPEFGVEIPDYRFDCLSITGLGAGLVNPKVLCPTDLSLLVVHINSAVLRTRSFYSGMTFLGSAPNLF